MNIDNSAIQWMLIGAAAALAIARYLGYLKIPGPAPTPAPGPNMALAYPQTPTAQVPTYEAVINIPHKLAVTPQTEVK